MKCKLPFLIFLLVILVQPVNADETEVNHADINEAIVEIIIRDYAELSRTSVNLNQELLEICTASSIENNPPVIIETNLQKTFLELRLAWAKVQFISFGPISFLERRDRFDYWPDKHRVGERQLRKLLSEKSFLNWTIESFREKSVAIQGLSALERILFSKEKRLNTDRCELAKLITMNLMSIATEVSTQWSKKPIEFKKDLLNPEPDFTFFANSKEVSSVLLNEMSTQLRFISDIKIANALPIKTKKKTNFKKLESWRTGNTFTIIKANIMSVESYYRQGFSARLIQFKPKTHQQIMMSFKRALHLVNIMNSLIETDKDQLLTKQSNLNHLCNLQSVLRDIDTLFKTDIVGTFNLNIKFNALDGD